MLQKKNYSGNGKVWNQDLDEVCVNDGLSNMSEPPRHCLQYFDGVFSRLASSMTGIQPGCEGQHDDDQRISEHIQEEKESG
jgi:hypothetical protein